MMVGITHAPEQVHAAPPEVRHWLRQRIGRTPGKRRPAVTVAMPATAGETRR